MNIQIFNIKILTCLIINISGDLINITPFYILDMLM
jgi:hypothetical protein